MEANAELRRRFRALAGGRELDLFEGALLIAALVDPSDDLEAARRAVASLASRVREAADRGAPPARALSQVLFAEEGLRGDDASYDEPSNSSVVRVLARRRGMPITLSILTVEVARQAGMRLAGVGLPGHFVVGGPDLPEGMFLDPFDGGALSDAGGLSRRLASIFGSPVALSEEVLRPDPPRAILARVLSNLRRSYERRDRWEEALEALEFAQALEPGHAGLERERGLLLLKCGRTEEALSALEEYASVAEGEDAEAVVKLIEAVRGHSAEPERRIFTLGEARALLPRVRELTEEAVERYARLPGELSGERQEIVQEWARELRSLGLEIKGVWLVDFDSGAGYYCWKYPEPALDHFHSYEEGFAGRLPLQ